VVRPTRRGTNAAEDAPIITDIHVTASAAAASLHLGFSESGSLHNPFPLLEAARIERPMAPIKEGTSRTKNAIMLRRRLDSAERRLYFNTELE